MPFTPSTTGDCTATLTVTDNASIFFFNDTLTAEIYTLSLHDALPIFSFGIQQVNTTSAPKAVTLSNTGSGSVTISSFAITGGNSGDFAETNNCSGHV